MPSGLALNVAVNTNPEDGGFRAPIYDDGGFEYIPILENNEARSQLQFPTYRDLDLDFELPVEDLDQVVHLDPEFGSHVLGEEYTYGDKNSRAGSIRKQLNEGDYLFFYGTLDYHGDGDPKHPWIHRKWGTYLLGHFKLKHNPVLGSEYSSLSDEIRSCFANNAHIRRPQFDADVLILGDDEGSKLYSYAVPLSVGNTRSQETHAPPNVISVEVFDSLSPGKNYAGAPWFRWPLRISGENLDILLDIIERVQQGKSGPEGLNRRLE